MIRNLFYLSASNTIQRLVGTVGFLILLRYLSLNDFGVWSLILSLSAPIIALMSLGMSTMVGTEISLARGRNQQERVRDLGQGLFRLSSMLAFVLLGLFYIVGWYSITKGWISVEYHSLLLPVTILFAVQAGSSYCETLLKSFENFKSVALIGATEVSIRVLVLVIGLWWYELSLLIVALAYLIARSAALLVALICSKSLLTWMFSRPITNRLLLLSIIRGYGRWGISKEVLTNFTESIRLWIVGVLISTEGVAIFNAASKATSFVAKAVPISSILQPMISRTIDDRKTVVRVIEKVRKYYTFYTIIASFSFASLITPFLESLAPQYVAGVLVFQLMTIRLIISGFFVGQPALLQAHLSQKFLFFQFILTFVTNILTNVLFILVLGLPGLALAMAVNVLSVALIREWYILSRLKYKFRYVRDLFNYDELDRKILYIIRNRFLKIIVGKLK